MKRKIIGILIFSILAFLFFRFGSPYLTAMGECNFHKRVYNQGFKGKVIRKYVDSNDHNYNMVDISMKNNSEQMSLNLSAGGYLNMFDLIHTNDSIIKEKKSICYRIKSNARGKDTLFEFYTHCRDNLKKH